MAASRKWKQNVAGSRKIVKRVIKSPIQCKIPRNQLSALRSISLNLGRYYFNIPVVLMRNKSGNRSKVASH